MIELIVNGAQIKFTIKDKNETKSINSSGAETSSAVGKSKHLNVGDEALYVGGVPNSIKDRITKQLQHVKNATSLSGCLTSLRVNSELKNLAQVEYSHKITPGCFFKEACHEVNNRCLNGATCLPVFSLAERDFSCQCNSASFTGSLCETAVEKEAPVALPLLAADERQVVAVKKRQDSCTESVESDYYVDAKSGCSTKRKLKIVKCRGECGSGGKSVRDSKLNAFSTADSKTPFGYLIGTNRKQVNARSLSSGKRRVGSGGACCVASVSKPRKLRLHCDDGRPSFMADVSLVKQCACSSTCEN
jgi:hypothetical protein